MKIVTSVLLALFFGALTSSYASASDTLPVKVTTRRALNSNTGLVAQFSNVGDKALPVRIEFDRAKTDATKTFMLTLKAGGVKEIGRTQGWIVHSGDKITVWSEGYETFLCHVQ